MPKLNHQGPEGHGAKTGRKLGNCRKSESESTLIGVLGKGLGKQRHSPFDTGAGMGKRINYFKTTDKK